VAAIVLATGLQAGCTAMQGFRAAADKPRVRAVPLPERELLEPISRNFFTLDSPGQSVVGEPQVVFATEENTFSDLAREYGLGYDEIVAANPGVDPWLPGAGTPVLLPTQYVLPDVPRHGVVLNLAAKRLYYFPEVADGEPVQVLTYPIGIGRVGWETPLGEATVIAKARDPSWYVPASVRREHAEQGDPLPAVVPPGPDNPLGKFVLKLDMPGYLIHGTNQPYGVGMRVSHGCVRLYPENIETLYELVDIGVPVRLINEPYLTGFRDGELYFEGHAPLEGDDRDPDEQVQAALERASGADEPLALDARNHAKAIASEALGIPVRVHLADAGEVFERARVVRNTVEPDPDVPTLEEVRALLDALPDEAPGAEALAADTPDE